MPNGLIILVCILVLGAWFLIGEKSFGDKLLLLVIALGVYVVYRLLGGATVADIFAPILQFLNNRNP